MWGRHWPTSSHSSAGASRLDDQEPGKNACRGMWITCHPGGQRGHKIATRKMLHKGPDGSVTRDRPSHRPPFFARPAIEQQEAEGKIMEYREPGAGGRDELLEAIEKGDAQELCEAMIATALKVDDRRWLQDEFITLLGHPNANVRAIAATSLGHVARIHGHLDTARVLPLLEEFRQHQKTWGFAETALEDIEMFARQP